MAPPQDERPELPRVLALDAHAGARDVYAEALGPHPPAVDGDFHPMQVPPAAPPVRSRRFSADLTLCASSGEALLQVERALTESRPFAVAYLDTDIDGVLALAADIRALDPLLEMVLVGDGPGLDALGLRLAPASKLVFLSRPLDAPAVEQLTRVLTAKWYGERQLRLSEARLATSQRLCEFGTWEWNRRTGEVHWNRQLTYLLGLPQDAGGGPVDRIWERIHPQDLARVHAEMGRAAHERGSHSIEYRICVPDRGVRHVRQESVPSIGMGDGDVWTVCSVQDVTERQGLEDSIRSLAYFDPLTRLPNRSFVSEYLHNVVQRSRRHGRTAALLHVDLDGFKRVNDTLGHDAGDRVLREVAARLESCVRDTDCVARDEAGCRGSVAGNRDAVARFGADEFIVILSQVTSVDDAGAVAKRVLERLAMPLEVGEREVTVSASIGIAVFPDHAEDGDRLLRNAALAMQSAKRRGRNTWECYSSVLCSPQSVDRLNLEAALRHALEAGGLTLNFQPKVRPDGMAVAGAEALLRWSHAELGTIPPSLFVPIAEESGLILPLGEWVIRTVCEQIASWRRAGLRPVPVSVNVSAQQLQDRTLVSKVQHILELTRVRPSELEFEITESVLMQESDSGENPLAELRAMGSHVSMDDFGTGYSSLSYLKRLPIDTVKIDRSFVRDILCDEDDQAILQAIITMAHQLRMKIVAEGVEDQRQLDLLTAMGCDLVQGYVIARPQPAECFARQFLGSAQKLAS